MKQTVRKRWALQAAAAGSGFAVMSFELAAVRILAPFYGTSVVVWTSILGVVLLSLAVGSWLGGRVADRAAADAALSAILLGAGAALIAVAASHHAFLVRLETAVPDPFWGALVGSLLVCGLPSALLAMVSPCCIRAAADDVAKLGAAAGGVGALGSVGSIAGTFLTGFVLLPLVSSTAIIAILGTVSAVLAVPFLKGRRVSAAAAVIILAGGVQSRQPAPFAHLGLDIDSAYSRILVLDHREGETGRPVRSVFFDPFAWQGSRYLQDDRRGVLSIERELEEKSLVIPYTRYFRLAADFAPAARSVLIIGGGVLSVPEELAKMFPHAIIDVVEIDPALTTLAREQFGFVDLPNIRISHLDGRLFLNRTADRYDVVILDAFTSAFSTPFHLVTREAIRRIRAVLRPGGVVLLNCIGSAAGAGSSFVRALHSTFQAEFPAVELVLVGAERDPAAMQNVLLAASMTPLDWRSRDALRAQYLLGRAASPAPGIVLTDDYAPVEFLSLGGVATPRRLRPPLDGRALR